MILNKNEDSMKCLLNYNGKTFKVGDIVTANASSIYDSLHGIITEIRTDKDKETDNEGIDIYVDFQLPALAYEYSDIISKFKNSKINVNQVIMAPEMLDTYDTTGIADSNESVYVVVQSWSTLGEANSSYEVFSNYAKAKYYFNKYLKEEITTGIVASNGGSKNMDIYEMRDKYIAHSNDILVTDYYNIEIKKCPLK